MKNRKRLQLLVWLNWLWNLPRVIAWRVKHK